MCTRCLPGLLLLAPAMAMLFAVAAHAQEIGVGTWKLNLAKSKYEPANLNRTYEFTALAGGNVTATTRTVIAADGKTRTNTTTSQSAQGRTLVSVAVYDKQ